MLLVSVIVTTATLSLRPYVSSVHLPSSLLSGWVALATSALPPRLFYLAGSLLRRSSYLARFELHSAVGSKMIPTFFRNSLILSASSFLASCLSCFSCSTILLFSTLLSALLSVLACSLSTFLFCEFLGEGLSPAAVSVALHLLIALPEPLLLVLLTAVI